MLPKDPVALFLRNLEAIGVHPSLLKPTPDHNLLPETLGARPRSQLFRLNAEVLELWKQVYFSAWNSATRQLFFLESYKCVGL